jgi:hypothetical protein
MKIPTILFLLLVLGEASAMGASSRLDWTSPGDDGRFGCANKYVVAYDTTSNITDARWGSLPHWTFSEPPLCAGSHETRYVGGLIQGKVYYFVLKTSDEAGNTSLISNVACDTAKTIAPPDSVNIKKGP